MNYELKGKCMYGLLTYIYLFQSFMSQILRISVDPYYSSTSLNGSIYGGLRLFIKGAGFDIESMDNQVYVGKIECEILTYYTSQTQLVCQIAEGSYLASTSNAITVFSAGKQIPCGQGNCSVNFSTSNSPFINAVVPNAIYPGQSIKAIGYLRSTSTSDILQIKIGKQNCNMPEDATRLDQWSTSADVNCDTLTDLEIGEKDFRLESKYGTGFAKVMEMASMFNLKTGNKYHVRVHPLISGLSSSVGYASGQNLEISGVGFGSDASAATVDIDGISASILSITDNTIVAELGQSNINSAQKYFIGGAGLDHRFYYLNTDLTTFQKRLDYPDVSGHIQDIKLTIETYPEDSRYIQRYRGLFCAPTTGLYTFYISSDDQSELNFSQVAFSKTATVSESTDFDKLCFITGWSLWRNFYQDVGTLKCQKQMDAGSCYHMLLLQREGGGADHLSVRVYIPNTDPTVPNRAFQVSKISIVNTPTEEQIIMKLYNVASGTFKLLFQTYDSTGKLAFNKLTASITWPPSASILNSAIYTATDWSPMTITRKNVDGSGNILDDSTLTADQLTAQTKGYAYYITFNFFRSNRAAPFLIDSALVKVSGVSSVGFNTAVLVEPSTPVTGTYKIQVGEYKSEEINVSHHEVSIETVLRAMPNLKDGVAVRADGDTYKMRTIYIDFTSIRGEAVSVSIVDNKIEGGPVATPVQITVTEHIPASNSIFSPSIPSELLFTVSDKPQVRVKVNDFYAACPGYKCDYSIISSGETPSVQSFTLNAHVLTIGLTTGYATMDDASLLIADNLLVKFGGSDCIITNVTLPTITCSLPKNADVNMAPIIEAGSHKPKVHLAKRGFLTMNATAQSFAITVTAISPLKSGSNGGLDITITGTGFGPSATVSINGTNCPIKSVSNISIVCTVPADAKNDGTTATIVSINSVSVSSSIFSYDPSITSVIAALSPKSVSPVLKDTLTITGTSFGTDKTKLKVTLIRTEKYKDQDIEYDCNVLTAAATSVTCRIGGGFSGKYKVVLTNSDRGFNKVNNEGDDIINFEIVVDSVIPASGSTQGGTVLTVTGRNFSTVLNGNQVIIGSKDLFCDITSATSTQLVCTTRAMTENMTGVQNVDVLGRIIEKAVCSGTCEFTYDDAATPKITAISSNSIVAGDSITLTGTNLQGSGDTVITLDSVKVTVTPTSDTSITFIVPIYQASVRTLNVLIPGKGYAKFSVSSSITNKLVYTDFSPKSGSRGGNILTLTGNGFDSSSAVVYAGSSSNKCNILSITPSEIKCALPSLSSNNTAYKIYIVHGSTTSECTDCSYTTISSSPSISSISATSFDTPASIQFTGSGSLLTSIDPANISVSLQSRTVSTLKLDGTVTYVISATNAGSITFNFSNIPVGVYDIKYFIQDVGYPVINTTNVFVTVNFSDSFTATSAVSSFNGGAEITITGNGFSTNDNTYAVTVCGRKCAVTSASFTQVKCLTPALVTQEANTAFNLEKSRVLKPVKVTSTSVNNIINLNDSNFGTAISSSSDSCEFTYDFGAGNQAYVQTIRFFPTLNSDEKYLNGAKLLGSNDNVTYTTLSTLVNTIENWNEYKPTSGSWNYRYIRFQGKKCGINEFEVEGNVYYSEAEVSLDSHKCSLAVKTDAKTVVKTEAVEYRTDATSLITSISPKLGTTVGGTVLTITGQILDAANSSVLIDNIPCVIDVSASSATSIVCTTGNRPTFVESTFVIKTSKGYAADQGITYLYIDRWSDEATWGGETLPREGDVVYVPPGQNLLVDTSTPILKAVIVEGSIVWEDEEDMTFDANYIFVRGGRLQVGTYEKPHLNKLTITLHGEKSDITLPGLGNKLIGAYTGTVDIHGKKRLPTWTLLQSTVNVGATSLTLIETVDWVAGETIIITPTDQDREHFEFLTITSVSVDLKTVNFSPPLKYNHFADTLTYDGKTFEVRAEVGLITRNVVIQGDENSIKTKYGVHVMMRGRGVTGRFSYIEVTKCGQAFQMGRYPIHFHMVGNVIGSFIEGCSIHHSNNRGSTIHGVHYLQITKNVYYQHLGHGIFIEDSVESNNIIRENLIMHTSRSSSLLMSDLKPAGIWITRPNNFITKNHAVGSQSFGFWFDLPFNPTGPSAVDTICLSGEPLGTFTDNTAHTNGIGLRIYPIYIPRTNPCAGVSNNGLVDPFSGNPPVLAEFNNVLVYSNAQGVFCRNIGAIKLENFGMISNGSGMGVAEPNSAPTYTPRLVNSVIVSVSPLTTLHGHKTGVGFVTGRKDGFLLDGVKFINFDSGHIFRACEGCDSPMHFDRGGRLTGFKNIGFENVTSNFLSYNSATRDKDIFKDEDGSLGKQIGFPASTGGWITPYFKHLESPECTKITDTKICSEPCLYCTNKVNIRRIDVQLFDSSSLLRGTTLKIFNLNMNTNFSVDTVSNDNYSLIPARDINGFMGWAVPFIGGNEYNLHWQTGVDFSHVNVLNDQTWLTTDPSVMLRFNNTSPRELYDISYTGIDDVTYVTNSLIPQSIAKPGATEQFGNSYYKDSLLYLKVDRTKRRGDVKITPVICRKTCPGDTNSTPTENAFRYWSKATDWTSGKVPVDGETVVVDSAWKMILDVPTAKLNILRIQGSLIADSTKTNLAINANIIHVMKTGSLLIGTDSEPFTNNFVINLFGSFNSDRIVIGPVIEPANKALIVAGQLGLYGVRRTPVWARLVRSALAGTTTINLAVSTDWKAGDEIVIASSSTDPNELEYATIQSKTNDTTFVLSKPLTYNHYGSSSTISTNYGILDMRTEVGVLSRNIKIIGSNDSDWGCRVLTARYQVYDDATSQLVWIEGKSTIQGVEIKSCGQKDTLQGALDYQYLQGTAQNSANNVVVRDGLGIGVNILNSNNLQFFNNIITNVRKYGIYTQNITNMRFEDNMIANIVDRPGYVSTEIFDLHIGFFYNEEKKLADNKVFINRNIISSTKWFGYSIPGHACNTSNNNFKSNIAHATRGGWFGGKSLTECSSYSDFIGYKNYEQGFINRYSIHQLYVYNMIMADNTNSLAVNGGSRSGKKYPISSIKDSVIYGKALTDCTFCYKSKNDCSTNGIITSIFEEGEFELKFNEFVLPLHNVTNTKYLWGGKQYIENVSFRNFQPTEICSDSFTIRTNQFVQETSVAVYLKNNQLINVNENNYFYFYNHTRLMGSSFCSKRDCTGIYNIILNDQSSNFFSEPTNFFGYNRGIAKDGNCTFKAEWNGHACKDKYMLLSMQQPTSERGTIISPMTFSIYQFDADVLAAEKYTNTVDNENNFPIIIKQNSYHHIEFSQSMPTGVIYKLDSPDITDWSIFRVQVADPATLVTIVNGKTIRSLVYKEGEEINLSTYKGTCGTNIYFPSNTTLAWIQTADPACLVQVVKTTTVKIIMRLDISITDFYKNFGTTSFIDLISALLNIPTNRLKVVGVRSGSTIIDFMILNNNIANGIVQTTDTASELSELTQLKEMLITKAASGGFNSIAPVLSLNASVVQDEDSQSSTTTYVPTCRFYNTKTYKLTKTELEESSLSSESPSTYISIKCSTCTAVDGCKDLIDDACNVNKQLMGASECDAITCTDCNTDSGSSIRSALLLLQLWLLTVLMK